MNYYKLMHWRKGNFIQTDSFITPYEYNNPNGLNSINHNEPIMFDLELPHFKLHRNAKWTDHINSSIVSSSSSLICSNKLSTILLGLAPEFQSFPIKISNYGLTETRTYSFLYYPIVSNELLDFNKSSFFLQANNATVGSKIKLLNFNCSEDINNFYEKLMKRPDGYKFMLHYHKLYLKSEIKLPLFRLGMPVNSFLISETLKAEMIKNEITGFEYLPFEDVSINKKFLSGYYEVV